MKAKVTKRFRFEAAHQLPNHDGKCRELHGHSYMVEVEVIGKINEDLQLAKDGMVIDFHDISMPWKNIIFPKIDHKNLNDVLERTTTAENIALWILVQFHKVSVPVYAVTVWETVTSGATVTTQEAWKSGEYVPNSH